MFIKIKHFYAWLVAGLVVILLTGCATPASSRFNPGVAFHTYSISVTDVSGKPISGVVVEWVTASNGISESRSVTTNDTGVGSITLTIQPKFSPGISWANYNSEAKYSVKKSGYLNVSGTMSESSYRTSTGGKEAYGETRKVVLVQPTDYLSEELATSKNYVQLRARVLDYLTYIRLESLLNQADLKYGGVRIQDFKGRRYLTLELVSENVFNSLKLDRYAIGKQVFDETVRKILNPLNEKISDPKSFYGYNIIVNTKVKSFSDKYAVGESLRYEFMMPQHVVRSYKEKNISGQKLIDESVIILNDERIDLKFQ